MPIEVNDGIFPLAGTIVDTDVLFINHQGVILHLSPSTLLDYIKSKLGTAYEGLLNQTGTGNPVATVFRNDVDAPAWVRTIAGTYTLTKTGAFPALKSIPVDAEECFDIDGNRFVLTWVNANQYKLETYAAVNTDLLADDVLVNRYIFIEIKL